MSDIRSVFKIFGSIGPGGSIAIFTEKFCRAVFNAGYLLGDPNLAPSKEFEEQA